MLLLMLFALIAGAGTAITPCVLPVLPALPAPPVVPATPPLPEFAAAPAVLPAPALPAAFEPAALPAPALLLFSGAGPPPLEEQAQIPNSAPSRREQRMQTAVLRAAARRNRLVVCANVRLLEYEYLVMLLDTSRVLEMGYRLGLLAARTLHEAKLAGGRDSRVAS